MLINTIFKRVFAPRPVRKGLGVGLLLFLCAGNILADNQQLAFPGAEGYGKYVTGGRGGEVCYVTRLDDCSDNELVPGTLRWAIRHDNGGKPRTILFATSGTIYLTSVLKFQYPDVSILGQSAPGGGVCVAGYNIYICKNNVIVRYMRFRAGDVPNSSMAGLDVENCKGVIIDHCSLTWSMEECLTAYDTDNTTVQWCIIGEGLYNSKNSKGARAYAMQWGGEHSTMHHTLITNSHSRSPRFNGARNPGNGHDTNVDSEFANNVIFNWSGTSAIYGGEMNTTQGYNKVFMVNNYYKPGPSTKVNKTQPFFVSPSTTAKTGDNLDYGQWYAAGNKFEETGNCCPWTQTDAQAANNDNLKALNGLPAEKKLSEIPYPLSGMTYDSADDAFASVTTKAGASLPRYDVVDRRILDEASGKILPQFVGASLRANGDLGIIDSPSDIELSSAEKFVAKMDGNAGYEVVTYPYLGMNEDDKYMVDTDADGMPDAYEDANGFNKNDATDGSAVAANGYTNLENYLNAIADGKINKADYETSVVYVAPGKSSAEGGYTINYSMGDSGAEGKLPSAQSGSDILLYSKGTVYKEGYTFVGWQGTDGRTYVIGERYNLTENVTLTPLFRKNTVSIADHQNTLNLTWNVMPFAVLGGSGTVVATNYVDGEFIDTRISYDNGKVTLPWDEDAYLTVNMGEHITSGEKGSMCTLDLSSALEGLGLNARLDLVLPVTKAASGDATVVWHSSNEAVQTPVGNFIDAVTVGSNFTAGSKSKNGITYWTFKPTTEKKVADENDMIEFTITPMEGVNFKPTSFSLRAMRFGTDKGKWNIAYVDSEGKEVSVANAISANRDNNPDGPSLWNYSLTDMPASDKPFKVRVYVYDVSGKEYGINDLTINGTYDGQAPVIIPCTFELKAYDNNMGTVTMEPEGNVFPAGTKVTLTIKEAKDYVYRGYMDEAASLHMDPSLVQVITVDCNMSYKPIFLNVELEKEYMEEAPYDAVCDSPVKLLLALKYAKNHAGEYDRMRILLKNGEYNLGVRALTEVPANVSLIGESQDGVVIKNNVGAVTDYQNQTPVLFINQNQDNVYMQDLTVCQTRDWETKKSAGQCVALRQRGKQAAYKNVTLQGVQDTYYLNKADATAYFETSTLAGEVDFIYGDGTAWFEKCNLQPVSSNAVVTASNAQPGYLGFIFNDCVIEKEPSVTSAVDGYALGRPWNDSPAVTYLNTTMKTLPLDAGWKAMTAGLVCRFHEYGSKNADGAVLDLSKRSIAACSADINSDEPVITATQASQYSVVATFPSWNPQMLTAQIDAPQPYYDSDKQTVFWGTALNAIGYAVYSDGELVGVTTECFMDGVEGEVQNIRAINAMGGLGSMSANAEPGEYAGITTVISNNRNARVFTYSLSGQRVNANHKGIVIINGKKFINK